MKIEEVNLESDSLGQLLDYAYNWEKYLNVKNPKNSTGFGVSKLDLMVEINRRINNKREGVELIDGFK